MKVGKVEQPEHVDAASGTPLGILLRIESLDRYSVDAEGLYSVGDGEFVLRREVLSLFPAVGIGKVEQPQENPDLWNRLRVEEEAHHWPGWGILGELERRAFMEGARTRRPAEPKVTHSTADVSLRERLTALVAEWEADASNNYEDTPGLYHAAKDLARALQSASEVSHPNPDAKHESWCCGYHVVNVDGSTPGAESCIRYGDYNEILRRYNPEAGILKAREPLPTSDEEPIYAESPCGVRFRIQQYRGPHPVVVLEDRCNYFYEAQGGESL
jgi:hypothetical protein